MTKGLRFLIGTGFPFGLASVARSLEELNSGFLGIFIEGAPAMFPSSVRIVSLLIDV